LIGRVGGASIGVAGPRGSGKSTLIREYCEEDSSAADDYEEFEWTSLLYSDLPKHARGDLRCTVAAPVDYVARDFVLHLFAAFCRAVIGRYGRKTRGLSGIARSIFWLRQVWRLLPFLLWRVIFYGGSAAALLYWQNAIARWLAVPSAWVRYTAIVAICVGIFDVVRLFPFELRWALRRVGEGGQKALAAEARKHISRVRYLQTHTSEWSGALSLLRGRLITKFRKEWCLETREPVKSYPREA
jgi:hypothetical protein